MEKLDYLIRYLLDENTDIKIDEISNDEISKKKLYRSLCNIREPNAISKEYIKYEKNKNKHNCLFNIINFYNYIWILCICFSIK